MSGSRLAYPRKHVRRKAISFIFPLQPTYSPKTLGEGNPSLDLRRRSVIMEKSSDPKKKREGKQNLSPPEDSVVKNGLSSERRGLAEVGLGRRGWAEGLREEGRYWYQMYAHVPLLVAFHKLEFVFLRLGNGILLVYYLIQQKLELVSLQGNMDIMGYGPLQRNWRKLVPLGQLGFTYLK
ncbi:hypothetical protein SO802_019032 [Lithocarpus litseifolius]|uniref:Uncharacterized protein n=1 Tax=Lithocarpus litseifolius TaxID=425828 RepID=A0AAW2CMM0_9ROSI